MGSIPANPSSLTLDPEYLDSTVGADAGNIARAMLRMRNDFERPLNLTGADLESELAADLMRFYPEKARFQGDDVHRALIQRTSERGASHGITGPNGISAYVNLAFGWA